MLVCAVGDLLLDVIVRLEEPLRPDDDARAQTHLGAGGQAANVAVWAAFLGASSRLIAKRARDPWARLVGAELARRGVEVLGPVVAGRSGVVVSLVESDGKRTMASDRGVAADLAPDEVDGAWLSGVDILHLSGYLLLRPPGEAAAAKAAEAAKTQGARVSVDLSSARGIEASGPRRLLRQLAALSPDVVLAGERELEALGSFPPAGEIVVKRGPAGVRVLRGGQSEDHAPLPGPVVDPTGAGDAFAAGFLLGGVELGLQAAARCVAAMGAMP